MDAQTSSRILRALAAGTNPVTGTPIATDSPLAQPEVLRALNAAVAALERAVEHDAQSVQARRSLPLNAGKPWSADADAQLTQGFDAGNTIAELAEQFGRTRGSIEARLVHLGRITDPRLMRFNEARLKQSAGAANAQEEPTA